MEEIILIDSKYCSADSGIIKLIEIHEKSIDKKLCYLLHIRAENAEGNIAYETPREATLVPLNLIDIFTNCNSLCEIIERVSRLKPNY